MDKKKKSDQVFRLKISDDNQLIAEMLSQKFKWLDNLPAGEYDMRFLKAFSGLSCTKSLKESLLKYGATIRQEIARANMVKDIFTWSGYKFKKEEEEQK